MSTATRIHPAVRFAIGFLLAPWLITDFSNLFGVAVAPAAIVAGAVLGGLGAVLSERAPIRRLGAVVVALLCADVAMRLMALAGNLAGIALAPSVVLAAGLVGVAFAVRYQPRLRLVLTRHAG